MWQNVDLHGERAVVGGVVGQQLAQPTTADLGDPVDLLGAPALGRTAEPGPERRDLAAERPGHGDGGVGRVASTALTAPPFSRRASAGYSDPNETPESARRQLGELLLELVAVQVLLVEEAEDGEVDHDVSMQYNGSIYPSQLSARGVLARKLAADGLRRIWRSSVELACGRSVLRVARRTRTAGAGG